jgi:hypothetical protein
MELADHMNNSHLNAMPPRNRKSRAGNARRSNSFRIREKIIEKNFRGLHDCATYVATTQRSRVGKDHLLIECAKRLAMWHIARR